MPRSPSERSFSRYILKPVREALILWEGSAELKAYLSVGIIALLAMIVPGGGKLVAVYRSLADSKAHP